MKLHIIKFLDYIDDKIFQHRWYWLCELIASSTWWDEIEDNK